MWVQFLYTLSLIMDACGLLGGILMNLRIVILTSSMPLWFPCEKCFPKGFSCLALFMSPKCPMNLFLRRRRVCPTYWRLQLLQVTAYIMFELRQDTFLMVAWLNPVVLLVRVPVLLMSLQYLQFVFFAV